jgi:N-acetylmuramoyl-L-alanine amidase
MVTPAGTPIYEKVEVGFAYGSAQVICDEDSITETLPLDEEAYGCGDRRLPWTELNRGQQPGARIWFGNQQNLMTLNVEICNNRDWMKASNNAQDWVVDQLLQRRLKVNVEASLDFQTMRTLKDDEVLIGRHFDVTGKLCPKPLVDDIALWMSFVNMINARTQFAA